MNKMTIKKIEFDEKLNDAGWVLIEEIRKYGQLSGHVFNNIKPCLKASIESYLHHKELEEAKEVEWVNGDAVCHSSLSKDQEARWVGYGVKKELSVIESLENNVWVLGRVWTSELSKPESPEAKEKREREEAAYDLYTSCAHAGGCTSYEIFVSEPVILKFWLSVVDKTEYRKGE